MTEKNKVLRIFESFVLGFCKCGCNQEIIRIRTSKTLRRFIKGHHIQGNTHPNWRGGRYLTNSGYWVVWYPNHPFCDSRDYVFEHRLVVEEREGRYLTKKEVVHHINGITWDNRSENLELFSGNGEHLRSELTIDKTNRFCLLCGEKTYVNKYGHEYWYMYKTGFICRKCYRKKS